MITTFEGVLALARELHTLSTTAANEMRAARGLGPFNQAESPMPDIHLILNRRLVEALCKDTDITIPDDYDWEL